MDIIYLFSYGTLMDIHIQTILFGETKVMHEAILHNHTVVADSDGYYYLKKEKMTTVRGKIIELSIKDIWIADQWEEIPKYIRQQEIVHLDNGEAKEVNVYFKTNIKDEHEISQDNLSSRSPNEVIRIAKKFRNQLQENHIPFSDLYLMFPCNIENSDRKWADTEKNDLIKNMESVSREEFKSLFSNSFSRAYIDRVYVKVEGFIQVCDIYLTFQETMNLGVVTITLPATTIPPVKMLHTMSSNGLMITDEDMSFELEIEKWMCNQGIDLLGTPRAVMFTHERPEEDDMLQLLACEETGDKFNINGKEITESARLNLAQYDSSEIFGFENFLIVIQNNFANNYSDRIIRQPLTLFICELVSLQDASISQVDEFINMHIYQKDNYIKNDLDTLEAIVDKSTKSIKLWDVRNFKYGTARMLAEKFSVAFGIQRLLQTQDSNKSRLEQLISIRSARVTEYENNNINILLIILTMLQVIPTLYSICISIYNNELDLLNYISGFASIFLCFILWGIFRLRIAKQKRKKIFKRNY